jgi:hypothetical protein
MRGRPIMKETFDNLWMIESDVKCVTTNGFVKKNGEAVMGAGVAKQAKMMYPELPKRVGQIISLLGNHVAPLPIPPIDYALWIFPVKHNWWEPADLDLIERSAHEAVEQANDISAILSREIIVALPRPGCGNGHRDWESEVRPLIAPILDDRFVVVELVKV